MRRLVTAACGAWALGCRSVVDPPLPDGARTFTPPPQFARWWAMTEACSGRAGDFGAIAWYVVPNAGSVLVRGEPVAGYWSRAGNRIVLAGTVAADGGVVRHEMLHALVRTGGHPRGDFVERCDGVVACESVCLAGDPAGAARAAERARAARAVTVADLELSVAVEPESPSARMDGGAFRLVVSARNPHPYAVVLPPEEAIQRPGYKWEYEASDGGAGFGGWVVNSADERVFDAGQTRRAVFDFVVSTTGASAWAPPGTSAFTPGTYTFRGLLDGRAAAVRVVLRP